MTDAQVPLPSAKGSGSKAVWLRRRIPLAILAVLTPAVLALGLEAWERHRFQGIPEHNPWALRELRALPEFQELVTPK